MKQNHLPPTDVRLVIEIAVRRRLMGPSRRRLLLSHLTLIYQASLLVDPSPLVQLELDLERLNSDPPASPSGERPIVGWLFNAADMIEPISPDDAEILRGMARTSGSTGPLTPLQQRIRRANGIADALTAFGPVRGDRTIRIYASFGSFSIPQQPTEEDPGLIAAIERERRAMHALLDAGDVVVRAILSPGSWRDVDVEDATPEDIQRRRRWLAYLSTLLDALQQENGWLLQVAIHRQLPYQNLMIIGERHMVFGSRRPGHSGYVVHSVETSPARIHEQIRGFDDYFGDLIRGVRDAHQLDSMARAIAQSRLDCVVKLRGEQAKLEAWLEKADVGDRAK